MEELTFTPVQRVVFKLIQGLPLDDTQKFPVRSFEPRPDGFTWTTTEHTERSYVWKLFREGRCNVSGRASGTGFKQVVLVAGRRSGKSVLAAALATKEMEGRVSTHTGTETLGCMTVSHIKDQAVLAYRSMVETMLLSPTLRPRLANETQMYIRFQTDDDIRRTGTWVGSQRQAQASIKVGAMASYAKGIRGNRLAFLCIDEPDAMMGDQAQEAWLAGAPCTHPWGGTVFIVGSPIRSSGRPKGWFRKQYEKREGLCLRIPTWEMNPTFDPGWLGSDYLKDPITFWAEWGACFIEEVHGERPVDAPVPYCSPTLHVPGVRLGDTVVFRPVTTEDLVGEMRRAARGEKDGHDLVIDAFRERVRRGHGGLTEGRREYEKYVEHDILVGGMSDAGGAQALPEGWAPPPDRVGEAMTLNEIGRRHREWQDKNFEHISTLTQGLVLAEECGEVARAIVKRHHGIRAHDRGNLAEELADVVLVAAGLAAREGIDLDEAVKAKAAKRDLKDFRARPETG